MSSIMSPFAAALAIRKIHDARDGWSYLFTLICYHLWKLLDPGSHLIHSYLVEIFFEDMITGSIQMNA